MTQLEAARKGIVTDAMKVVAKDEGLDAEKVRIPGWAAGSSRPCVRQTGFCSFRTASGATACPATKCRPGSLQTHSNLVCSRLFDKSKWQTLVAQKSHHITLFVAKKISHNH